MHWYSHLEGNLGIKQIGTEQQPSMGESMMDKLRILYGMTEVSHERHHLPYNKYSQFLLLTLSKMASKRAWD